MNRIWRQPRVRNSSGSGEKAELQIATDRIMAKTKAK
jgi:hypothetical protein